MKTETSQTTDGRALAAQVARKRWVAPEVTRAGRVSDLVQALKASGGTDCGGTRHFVSPSDTCGL